MTARKQGRKMVTEEGRKEPRGRPQRRREKKEKPKKGHQRAVKVGRFPDSCPSSWS